MKTLLSILFTVILTVSAAVAQTTYGNSPALVARFECPPAPNLGALNLVIPDLAHFNALGGIILPGYPPYGAVTSVEVSVSSQGGNGQPPEFSQTLIPNPTGETFVSTGLLGDTTKSYTVSIIYSTINGYNIRFNTTVHQAHEGWWIQGTGGFNTAPYSGYLGCPNITQAPSGAPQDYWYTYKDKGNGKGKGRNK